VFPPFSVCCFCNFLRKQFINTGNFGTGAGRNGRNVGGGGGGDKGWKRVTT